MPSSPMKRMSRLGFGCARIGSFNNTMSSRESERLLAHALDLGVTLFDTADIYGQGDSERAVGRLLRGRRDDAFVVTKVGQTFSTAMRLARPLKPLLRALTRHSSAMRSGVSGRRPEVMATDFSARYVSGAIDASLRRLGFDTIDAVLLHSPMGSQIDPSLDRILDDARRAGKIRSFGVACDDVACVAAALRLPNLTILELPPPVLVAAAPAIGEAVVRRDLKVLVREVIRYRDTMAPRDAVAVMAARRDVASVIIGTTSRDHLDDIAGLVDPRALQRSASRECSRLGSPAAGAGVL